MAREKFIDKNFQKETLHMIRQAAAITDEYFAKGFVMTLRQLHYQFVARAMTNLKGIPYPNTDQSYDRLGSAVADGRLAGLIDWAAMEDRQRTLERIARWNSPAEIIDAVSSQYQEDLWAGQKVRPEVWIEKDALSGVVANICEELRVDYFACRGYVSASAHYQSAKRFKRYLSQGQRPVVLHFGDHDPSGIDMTRENAAKFKLLTGVDIEVRRLALNMDQIEQYNPPPNPTKLSDSRAPKYVEEFGNSSWELDALDPEVFEQLIRDAVTPYINKAMKAKARQGEMAGQAILAKCSALWDGVEDFLDRTDTDE